MSRSSRHIAVNTIITTIISRGCKLLQKQLGVEYKLAQEWRKNHVIRISNEYNQCGTRGFVTTKTKQYTCSEYIKNTNQMVLRVMDSVT